MQFLKDSLSNQLSLEQVLKRLERAESVMGLALFGSQPKAQTDSVSDYDILILLSDSPVPIFQMLSHIDGRMADLVFIETETVDTLLSQEQAVAANSFEGYFVQKMLAARIVYDPSNRLKSAQDYSRKQQSAKQLLLPHSESDAYSIWFWLNHGLYHMKRMIQSEDLVYLTAVNLMLMTCLGGICRDYFRLRDIAWEGEKAAIRYLQAHDAAFLELLQTTLTETILSIRLSRYEQLVIETLKPIGTLWESGITTVYLRDLPQSKPRLELALHFWQELIGSA